MYSNKYTLAQFKASYSGIKDNTDWKSRFEFVSKALNRSFPDLADLIGYTFSGFRQVNAGSVPSFYMLMDMVNYAHVNPYWLFSDGTSVGDEILTDNYRKRGTQKEICSRVNLIRRSFGMNYEEFGSFLGYLGYSGYSERSSHTLDVTKVPVSKICRGEFLPDDSFLVRVANVCDIGVDWIISGDEKSRNYPVNERMTGFLWNNEEERTAIREMMKSCAENAGDGAGHKDKTDAKNDRADEKPAADDDHINAYYINALRYMLPSACVGFEMNKDADRIEDSETGQSREDEPKDIERGEADLEAMAERMKSLRIQKGVSQVVFAEMADVSKSTVARWELGKTRPDKSTLRRISESLGVGMDWVLYGDESRKKFPCDMKMVEFLKEHEEIREMLWVRMRS